MCFDSTPRRRSRVIAGAAVSHDDLVLTAADGNALRGVPRDARRAGDDRRRDPSRRARALPLLRGARAALRRARLSPRSRSTTSAARPASRSATTTSSTCRTSTRRRTRACRRTPRAAVEQLRELGCTLGLHASASASAAAPRGSPRRRATASPARSASTARRRASAADRAPSQRVGADRVPDPRAAGGRRPGHHRRGQRRVRARRSPTPASSTRSSRTTGRRTASSTASRRSSPTRPTTPGGARSRSSPRPLVILAIDQGTTGTTCLVVDDELRVPGRGYARAAAALPAPGLGRARPRGDLAERPRRRAPSAAGLATSVDTVAITNQRETTLLWDRATGEPVAPAIVWQDRRTAERCRELDAGADPRAHRARSRPVLLGDEARVAPARAPVAPGSRSAPSTAGSSGS